jgi:outer membrane protein OmpA-like peptidoglycan-associated protein
LLGNYFRTLKYYRDQPAELNEAVRASTKLNEEQVAAMLKGVRWMNLTENAREWFGVGYSDRPGHEGLVDTIESAAQILQDSGDFRESPLPGRDPYRLQHRVYVEKLYEETASGQLDAAAKKDAPEGEPVFAALPPEAWDSLVEVGTFRIRPITYQSGTAELSYAGKEELDRAAQSLAHYPSFRVVIRGHTGTRGDPTANRALSQARADSVQRYLAITHGLDANRMRAVGLGGEHPLPRDPGESDRSYEYRLPRVELSLVLEAL